MKFPAAKSLGPQLVVPARRHKVGVVEPRVAQDKALSSACRNCHHMLRHMEYVHIQRANAFGKSTRSPYWMIRHNVTNDEVCHFSGPRFQTSSIASTDAYCLSREARSELSYADDIWPSETQKSLRIENCSHGETPKKRHWISERESRNRHTSFTSHPLQFKVGKPPSSPKVKSSIANCAPVALAQF